VDVREVRIGDPEYPPLLREVPDAPPLLYAAGCALEPAPMVSVVGTRRASRYGLEVAAWLTRGLAAAGLLVVSGMALGVDAAAHRGALDGGGTTVAVLGCGLDVCYPLANAALRAAILERGTLLSEHPAGVRPRAWYFPIRNRIIAGMSLGTVIVEARKAGGALITARLASDLGREVFAVPGPVNADGSRGAHALVRDGARLVTCAADVLEDLGFGDLPGLCGSCGPSGPCGPAGLTGPAGPDAGAQPQGAGASAGPGSGLAGVGPDEQRLFAVLEAEPLLLDAIALRARLPVSAAAAVLARLELKGVATRHPGGRFARAFCA
jgi:DNA processing protein